MLILQASDFLEHYQFKAVKLEWFCELLWIKQRFGNLMTLSNVKISVTT